ncbi:hypothetical protein FQZ97_698700 [compost metagenome]
MGTPFMRSITMTSGWQKSQNISGISTRSSEAMLRRSWAALAASRTRSSSSCRYLSNSPTTSRGFRRLPSGESFSIQPAIMAMRARSFSITPRMLGRSTFTATSRISPWLVRMVAKCTCAIEALAMGVSSNCTNTSLTGRRKARSMVATATAEGNGGTRSCRKASSSAMSGGSRSRRVDSTWPNFTKIGPSRSSASRRRWPRGASRLRPIETMRATTRSQGFWKLVSTSSSRP